HSGKAVDTCRDAVPHLGALSHGTARVRRGGRSRAAPDRIAGGAARGGLARGARARPRLPARGRRPGRRRACGRPRSAAPAERIVLAGVRDLDPPEREALERSATTVVGAGLDTLVAVQNAVNSAPVYVHLDSDVVEAMRPDKLYDLLEAVADESEIVGIEVKCEPKYVEGAGGALAALRKEAHVHN